MAERRRRRLGTAAAAALAGAAALALAGVLVWPSTGRRDATLSSPAPRPARQAGAPGDRGATPAPPRRIISLLPSHTEILFALGAGDRVVAVTEPDDFPPAAAALPRVGGMTSATLDLERVVAARPDLVVAVDLDQREAVDALRRLGLAVEVVPAAGLSDLFAAVRRLGELSGRPEAAARLAASLGERIERVRRAVAELPPGARPRVFYEVWDRPLMTAGGSAFVSELIETAGGRNVFADVGSLYPRISPEAVLERDPEVILAPDRHGEPLTAEELAARPGWEALRAVRDGRVYTVDGDLVSRPGPRLVEALEIVARLLHPDRFPPPPREGGGA